MTTGIILISLIKIEHNFKELIAVPARKKREINQVSK